MRIITTDLRNALAYAPDTGVFTWKNTPCMKIKPGDIAGHLDKSDDYHRIYVGGRSYKTSHLAWFYVYGQWPSSQIDHINGVPSDNRIANLRLATPLENARNRKMYVNNQSGFKGVSRHQNGRYRADIGIKGRVLYLGLFDTPKEASAAYSAAAREHFGEFVRHGK